VPSWAFLWAFPLGGDAPEGAVATKLTVECVGGNGLPDSEVELLTGRLENLDRIRASRSRLGGNEAALVSDMQRRVVNRLSPEIPGDLASAADKLISTYLPTIEAGQTEMRSREFAAAATELEHLAQSEARAVAMSARIKAADEKQRAAAREAVDEVIL
jgi:hypothetical protein